MNNLKINSKDLVPYKSPCGSGKEIWTLKHEHVKYFVKKPESTYTAHAEGFGSYITHKYYPNTVLCKAVTDENNNLYVLSEDMNKRKKYITISDYMKKKPSSYEDIINYFNKLDTNENFNYDFLMMLIQDAFTLNPDRHINNIFISKGKKNISLSKTIDFDRCFASLYFNCMGDRVVKEEIKYMDINKVEGSYQMSKKFKFNKTIEELIEYIKENSLYVNDVSNQADCMSYEKDLKEYGNLIGMYVPEDIKKTFIGLGNARQERIKKLLNKPIVR